jgi:hypothetical protein
MQGTFVTQFLSFSLALWGDVVGSGAVVPCGDRPSHALRTVRAACHRTRLALYMLLEMLCVGKCTGIKVMMTGATQNHCFSVAGRHHALPACLSCCSISHRSSMMNFTWPLLCFTELTLAPVQSFYDFRAAACPDVPVRLDIELCVGRRGFFEILESGRPPLQWCGADTPSVEAHPADGVLSVPPQKREIDTLVAARKRVRHDAPFSAWR